MPQPSPLDELRRLQAVTSGLRSQLAALEGELARLKARLDQSREPSASPYITPPPVISVSMLPQSPVAAEVGAAAPSTRAPDFRGLIAPKIEEQVKKSADTNLEARIGGTWFNRVGAIILLLGIAFFVKYSFDQGWLSPSVRVFMGAMLGAALIVAGEVALLRELRNFAVGLLGAGIAVLFVSAFAAHAFYALIALKTAFALLCVVTALSTIIAVNGRVLAIAILALIGGFLTPVLLSTGQNQQTALLTYLTVLDAGFLVVGFLRGWWILRVLSWVCTAGLFFGWYTNYFEPAALDPTLAWIAIFYILFQIASVLAARHTSEQPEGIAFFIHLQNAALFASVYLLADATHHKWMALFCLIVAGLQAISALLIRHKTESKSVQTALWMDAATLVAIAIPIQFDGYVVALAWAAQACVYAWFCRTVPAKWLRAKMVILFLLALADLVMFGLNDDALTRTLASAWLWHLNWIIIDFVAVGLAAHLAAVTIMYRREKSNDEQALGAALIIIGTIAILGIFAQQYDRYLATLCWMVVAGVWLIVGMRIASARVMPIALMFLIVIKYIATDLLQAATGSPPYWQELSGVVFNRAVIIGLSIALAAMIVRSFALPLPGLVASDKTNSQASVPLLLLCPIVLLAAGTFEICRVFTFEPLRERFADPMRAMQLSLSVYWGVAAMVMLLIGFARKIGPLRYMAIGLFAITVLKVLLVDIASLRTIYRIISFTALGLLLLAASYLYQKRTLRSRQAGVEES
jgi:uncharacterized membrane protein